MANGSLAQCAIRFWCRRNAVWWALLARIFRDGGQGIVIYSTTLTRVCSRPSDTCDRSVNVRSRLRAYSCGREAERVIDRFQKAFLARDSLPGNVECCAVIH